jgi:hypothetical protein
MNSNGLKPARAGPRTGETCPRARRARAQAGGFAQRTLVVQITSKESLATIHCLPDILT